MLFDIEPLLFIPVIASFICTYLLLPFWINKAHVYGLVGKDIHKTKKTKVAEGGGIIVLAGIAVGILLYIAINTFYFRNESHLIQIFAILSVLFLSAFVGIVDDFFGWKKGLSKRMRLMMILFAAVPLMVINAGVSKMSFPFFGNVELGLFYPLLMIPLGIVGATATFNFLAGYNGLESSQGILLLSALAYATYVTGSSWLSLICAFSALSLLAFWFFNKYPAEVFPGDTMTYPVGALIASVAIIGNVEKVAVFFFIPYIIETLLKSRGKLEKESFGKVKKDESLDLPYKKIYGLEHLSIHVLKKIKPSKKVYEKDVVCLINGFQIAIIITGILIFL